MSAEFAQVNQYDCKDDFISLAATLLNQQVWCWGRDICRKEGNWLLEIGFQRIEAEESNDAVDSVYSLRLPAGQNLVLRGYGVFYGNPEYGGIFLPRYEFIPGYTNHSILESPPWKESDLPELKFPSQSEWKNYIALLVDLIYWIKNYEQNVIQNLGLEYRHYTLTEWDNGTREIIAAKDIVSEWGKIGKEISAGILN